jgi:adenylate cyclase
MEAVVTCRHTAEQLWPYISQSDLYNRATGSAAEYTAVPVSGSAAVIQTSARKFGLTVRYQEMPYEWHQPHFVQSEMIFQSGPVRYTRIRGEMLPEQSAVRYRVDYVPRRRFGLAGLMARRALKDYVAVLREIDERLPDSFHDPLAAKGFEDRGDARLRRAQDLADRWRGLADDAVVPDALAEFVMTAPDTLVGRMRPYGLAQQLGTSRSETLQFCCRATEAGFLDLSWDLICPSCGGAKRRSGTLAGLGTEAHCDVCNIRYDADFARNVELSFRPRSELRRLDEREYCLQSPSHQRQILAQVNLAPGATRPLSLSLGPGHYRLRCIGRDGETVFHAAYGRSRREVAVRVGSELERNEIDCGSVVDLLLENASPEWRTVRFEHHGYREDAATAAEIALLPEFLESFDAPVLPSTSRASR